MSEPEKRYDCLNLILNNPKIKLVIKINTENGRVYTKVVGL